MRNEATSTLERRVTRVPIWLSALGHHFQGYQRRRSSRRSRGNDQGLSELVPPIFTKRSHSGSWCLRVFVVQPRKLPNEPMRSARRFQIPFKVQRFRKCETKPAAPNAQKET